MTLSEELTWRGFVGQTTYNDVKSLDKDEISFYIGVDPSADSMTIGNLAAIMLVRHFIEHGHKAYLLVGGATGMIGDPDGKATERKLQTLESISYNKNRIMAQYKQLLANQSFTIVDNYDWFKSINYLDFLREVGKNVPLNQMLGRDFVKSRLSSEGSGISYAEFSYCLIQGYDFLHLNREHNVTLQLCGADQWGNSITGVDLIRRLEGKDANVFSTPLVINKATGVKFGKSEAGAVWLDHEKTSVYSFYQFWLNADDAGVADYLKIYTFLEQSQIEALAEATRINPGAREAQKTLAHEVTKLVHGEERTASVERVTSVLFGVEDFNSLTDKDIDLLAHEIPIAELGKTLVESMMTTGLVSSNGEARRMIESGAVSVNGVKTAKDSVISIRSLIKKGKNKFILVR